MKRRTIIRGERALLPNSPDAVFGPWVLWLVAQVRCMELRFCSKLYPQCWHGVTDPHKQIPGAFAQPCTAAALLSLILSIQPIR